LLTRAGIGIPTIDNDRLPATGAKMVSIQDYRRGYNAIPGENPGDRSANIGHTEGQIEEVGFFDPTMDAGGLEPQRCGDASARLFHDDFSAWIIVERAIVAGGVVTDNCPAQ
jgi:hypothetical protein